MYYKLFENLKIQHLFLLMSLGFTACAGDDSNESEEEEVVEEEQYIIESGDYVGSWSSTTDTGATFSVSISAKLTAGAEGRFSGPFYISSNFTSCCDSGENDGNVSFTMNGNTLQRFVYNDIIPNCRGTFSGSGRLTDDNKINVTFTGRDCDGNHNGTLTLSLQP